MCDLAYAVLMEQREGDARASVAAGAEISVADERQALDDALAQEPRHLKVAGREERELRSALGVA